MCGTSAAPDVSNKVRAPGHITLFFDIYNVFVVSCQLICAESNSDVYQFVSVEHFFLLFIKKTASNLFNVV